ncbi:aminotransferase class III-fold pyridoxal phosphate-dependent enzyme [Candidatus Woesearchaeota archaeon]|nr:aminotransferase class III-fold pyridoxal phosphate-dependent enzyme [Candidatus Woesearchaeota archaeon]
MADNFNLSTKTKNILKRDKISLANCMTREYPLVYKKAKGMYIYDINNKKYLDFCASVAVMNIGHTNKEVINAIKKQLNYGLHCAFPDFYAELPVKYVETVKQFVSKKFNQAFLSNSGTESVETALKMAKWHTNKKWVIAFEHAFHGRTMGSLSMTKSKPVQRDRFGPFIPVKHVPYAYVYRHPSNDEQECVNDCLNKLEKTAKSVKNNLAAIFMEPIQGEGGYIVPPKEFVKGVREICNKYDALLCDDEVQAGCFRTGKFLAIENFNVTPDIICLSKSVGGGIPLGITLANKSIQDWGPGTHANTFGGNLVACASGIATLEYMKKHNIGENAVKIGNYIKKRLIEMKEKYILIGDVRGIGLMIGVEFVKNRKTKEFAKKERDKILNKCFNKGLILLAAGTSVIRICPPLIITKNQADKGLNILEHSIKEVQNVNY